MEQPIEKKKKKRKGGGTRNTTRQPVVLSIFSKISVTLGGRIRPWPCSYYALLALLEARSHAVDRCVRIAKGETVVPVLVQLKLVTAPL